MLCVLIRARGWATSRFNKGVVIFLILFALVTLSWLPRLSGPIDLRWDGGAYYVLGTSLAEGKGYRLLNEPGDIDATQYPPLLPAIIAAHQWLLGTSDPMIVGRWLRLSFFLVFAAYIFATYLMVKVYLPLKYAFLATFLCLFSYYTYFLSDLCFPEILFGLTTTLFVLFNRSNTRRIYPVVAALLAMASYGLRTIGVALLAAWIGESLFNREFKLAAIRLTLSLIPILCWQSYISSVESGQRYNNPVYSYQRADYLFYNVSYSKNMALKNPRTPELGYASFEDMAHRFLLNLAEIPTTLGQTVTTVKVLWEMQRAWFKKKFPFLPNNRWPLHSVLIILGCFILGGVGLQLKERQWIIPFYILISLAGLCLTPWPGQFMRYLTPLAPFLVLSLFRLLLHLRDQPHKTLSGKWRRGGRVFTSLIVFLMIIQELFAFCFVYLKWHQEVAYADRNGDRVRYRLFFYDDAYRTLDAGLDWIRLRAKPGDVVAASMPHWVYLRTGLKAVMPPFEPNPVKAQDLLDSVPVSHVILGDGLPQDDITRRYTAPVVENSPERWTSVYSDSVIAEFGEELKGRFEIYQRVDQPMPLTRRKSQLITHSHSPANEEEMGQE